MLKLLFSLYLICYCCYIFYTREPDYFDGETTQAIIQINEQTKTATATFLVANKIYTINANYFLRKLKNNQKIEIIYVPHHPEKAAVYSLWGYWVCWGELLMSTILLLALYQLSVSITQNPSAETIKSQQEIIDVPLKKYD